MTAAWSADWARTSKRMITSRGLPWSTFCRIAPFGNDAQAGQAMVPGLVGVIESEEPALHVGAVEL